MMLVLVCMFLQTCNWKSEVALEATRGAIVVFNVGDNVIQKPDGTVTFITLGTEVKGGDTIKTNDRGKVDIQFMTGTSIRVAPSTVLTIDALIKQSEVRDHNYIRITLPAGKLFANVNKINKKDEFKILTPTTIAGVRGTSFIVDVDKGKTNVKVNSGSVGLAMLDKSSLENYDVIATEGLEIKTVDKKYRLVKSTINMEEEKELATVISVLPNIAEKLIETSKNDGLELRKLELQIESLQESKRKDFIRSRAENPKRFKSNKEIQNYYGRLEMIKLTDGGKYVGAIMLQKDEKMYVNSEHMIYEIDMNKIEEVIYDYTIK